MIKIVKRFASSQASPKTFLPSVSWLIEKNHLDATKITPSGPKNNILKGDVLKFLEKGGLIENFEEILENQNYFQMDLKSLRSEWLEALKSSEHLC